MKALSFFSIVAVLVFATAATPVPPTKIIGKFSNDFSFVRGHRQGKGATITWGFTSSNANGFTVQRTYEDPNDPYSVWENVCDVGCNGSKSYKHNDQTVFPGFVNYRIVAAMNDGSTETSDLIVVHVVAH